VIVPHPYTGKRIAVFGLARTGLAAVRALQAAGAEVLAWDDDADRRAPVPDLAQALYAADFAALDALVLAPGVPLTHPQPHPLVTKAKQAGLPLLSDIDLFEAARPALPAHKLVGVTGTNGKSTTVALIAHLIQQAGLPAVAAGNIGVPVLSLNPLEEGGVYVLELSSFQLDLTQAVRPDVAVWLNLTPDHLDRHGSMAAYAAAKGRLFANLPGGAQAIVGVDQAEGRALAERLDGRTDLITVSIDKTPAQIQVNDQGRLLEGTHPLGALSGLKALRGRHNWQNAAAAFACGRALGLGQTALLDGLASFPGLAHRQEPVPGPDGIAYVNDSKATNWAAAATALSAFDRVHWIAGGRMKDQDWDMLDPFLPHVRAAYLVGEAAPALQAHFGARVDCIDCGTVTEAVPRAHARAVPGDTVLLSPGCASQDQFRDFEARGEAFKAAVAALNTGGRA